MQLVCDIIKSEAKENFEVIKGCLRRAYKGKHFMLIF